MQPDVVFTRARVAVFVQGCFWHRCPQHATFPEANADYWRAKFERNVARDEADTRALVDAGWEVVRVWEHEPPDEAADRVEEVAARRRGVEGVSPTVSPTPQK